MLKKIACRAIASVVAFLCGCGASEVARPGVENVPPTECCAREISAITYRSHGCADLELKCSRFDVTFRNDGTATYNGYENADLIGEYAAFSPAVDFVLIASEVKEQDFFAMPRTISATGVETVSLEVVTTEGKHTVMTHSWPSTPLSLRKLHALVNHQIHQVRWEKVH